jgi:hypothetical protein
MRSESVASGEVRSLLLLIENKIDEDFQDQQVARYREQANAAVECAEVTDSFIVLIAPAAYSDSHPEAEAFDARIAYEDVIDFLKSRERIGDSEGRRRAEYKRGMFEQALYRYRRGYVPEPHEDVSNLWQGYYELASRVAPTLKLKRPNLKPGRSDWIAFTSALVRSPPIPPCFLRHKLGYGRVDLEFSGCIDQFDRLVRVLRPLLREGMTIRRASKSVAVSLPAPVVDRYRNLPTQAEDAERGLCAAVRLQEWYDECRDELGRIFAPTEDVER